MPLRLFLLALCLALSPLSYRLSGATLPGSKAEFIFALYYTLPPGVDPDREVTRILTDPSLHLRLIGQPATSQPSPAAAGPPVATVEFRTGTLAEYAPPKPETQRLTSLGTEPTPLLPLFARADHSIIVQFSAPLRGATAANLAADTALDRLAAALPGVIWDRTTLQLFTPESWRHDRVDSWQGPLPDAELQLNVLGGVRAGRASVTTLGLFKFGLSDEAFTDLPPASWVPCVPLLIASVQFALEQPWPRRVESDLVLADLKHTAARQRQLARAAPGATAQAAISAGQILGMELPNPEELAAGKLEIAFAQQEPWWSPQAFELEFPDAPPPTTGGGRVLWALHELYGAAGPRPTDLERAVAGQSARRLFLCYEEYFRGGLGRGGHLLAKTTVSEGSLRESVWIEVIKWGEGEVAGAITEPPQILQTHRTGAHLVVKLTDIEDCLLNDPLPRPR